MSCSRKDRFEANRQVIGRTLSHFKITAKLGEGGMGEVYLAHDTQLERKVALKVLPAELAEDPERLKRLQREARSLAALDHPHVVPVYSLESAEGVHFLTMAFIEGEPLEQLIPDEGFSVERLLDLAVPLADALRAAHRQGIIHRDLKPANVMLDRDGRLRVLDFGLAKRDVAAVGALSQLATQERRGRRSQPAGNTRADRADDPGRDGSRHLPLYVSGAGRREGGRCAL